MCLLKLYDNMGYVDVQHCPHECGLDTFDDDVCVENKCCSNVKTYVWVIERGEP